MWVFFLVAILAVLAVLVFAVVIVLAIRDDGAGTAYRPCRVPLDDVVERFPPCFALAGWPGRVFKISRDRSRLDPDGAAYLVIVQQRREGDWCRFATMTVAQLERDWRPLVAPLVAQEG